MDQVAIFSDKKAPIPRADEEEIKRRIEQIKKRENLE